VVLVGAGRGVAQLTSSVTTVFRNPGLRRVQLAFFGSGLGDWAYATAITVWAYQDGGATAVGAFQAVRFIVGAVIAPVGATVADRMSRRTFMLVSDAARAVLVAAAAVCVTVDLPPAVYALALAAVVVGAPFRAAQAGLVPQLASTPDELTASNAVASNLENVMVFAGPAIGALLVGAFDVETAIWVNVATFAWSLSLVAGIREPARDSSDAGDVEADGGLLRETLDGVVVIVRDPDLRTTAALAAVQGMLFGALMVFNVIIAIEMLDAGPDGVGYLLSISGVGTIVGGLVVLARVGRHRVASDMSVGVIGWALPFVLLAAFPSAPVAVIALLVVGLMDPWVNLGLDTLPQRLADERMVSRVFATVDASLTAAMAIGSVVAPLLLEALDLRGALLLLGAAGTAYAATTLPRMRRLDARLQPPPDTDLLQAIPMFAPLPSSSIEALALASERRRVASGEVVVSEGDIAQEFFVIVEGDVEISHHGAVLRREGPGEVFGEIGLLRDVPRTATVTALTDVELLVLGRRPFLECVSGTLESLRAAEDLAWRRLAV
jgi:predicted MFS family arabinose efflux permease